MEFYIFSRVEKSVNEGNTGTLREKREITEFNELRQMTLSVPSITRKEIFNEYQNE